MDVKIGIANIAREVTLESELSTNQVEEAVQQALSSGTPLRLEDARGRVVVVPAAALGYVDIGEPSKPRVGFGA